ncbi:HAD family hydrolase [Anaerorhabdus sp.]|jgi:Cof subfamily protein (haloacid dehalogenase superfamily)|uniref:HAD family hydrolase n=1 Tax=Anaerorhabdus sp. TaxID=1872524 RepID=UPI002FCA9B83
MIKLIVADCDGTILDDNKKIDPQLKTVITELEKKNITFTLASGRNIFLMSEIIDDLNIQCPYIINNGASIYQGNKSIKNYLLPKESIHEILSILENGNFPFLAYSETDLYMYSSHSLLEGFKVRLKNKLNFVEFDSSMKLNNVELFKITIATDDVNEIKEVKDKIERLYPSLNFKRSEGTLFSITNGEATKGNAIKTIADMMNVKKEEIMIFGDNYNDITMFDVAGVGVAMGNSDEEIKALATHNALDNNHNGVSEFLEKYFSL